MVAAENALVHDRGMRKFLSLVLVGACLSCSTSQHDAKNDSFLWLEDVEGKAALDWVKARNEKSLGTFEKDALFKKFERPIRKILLAKDRIPAPTYRDGYVYNFWQDEKKVRGVWRRTSLSEYRKTEPRWQILLDLDKLAATEKENWVWAAPVCLKRPSLRRCLVRLSRGGKDAAVVREFDLESKSFVKGGFSLPEAKTRVDWLDENNLIVGTDFGAGSQTLSGYARVMKLWKRGEALENAKTVFEVKTSDVSADIDTYSNTHGKLVLLTRWISFFEQESFVFNAQTKALVKLPIPNDVRVVDVFDGHLFVIPRTPWKTADQVFAAGSLVALSAENLNAKPELVYEPNDRTALRAVDAAKDALYVAVLENVKGKLWRITRGEKGWLREPVKLKQNGTVSVVSADGYESTVLLQYESFLTPTTIFKYDGKTPVAIKRLPHRFDATPMEVSQHQAISRDGTKIPYFIIHKKGLKLNGVNPTILYGYGGFEISLSPSYLGVIGATWLTRGGVYAIANIRGGGEFGPRWHQAALRENRQTGFDDFAAVAENLSSRKITSARHLGISGGSNGGLLVGATFTQRPDLIGAAVCKVPLLDMLRYTKLLAGHSWIGEYGDPENSKVREALLAYSPYQALKKEKRYPRVFFITSTKDDRVHPGHARKMAAKMESQGHDLYYFENIEGGHGAAANIDQRIRMTSLELTYLSRQLGL